MPLTQTANLGRPMTTLSHNKENQHKKAKIIATSASQTQLRRRRRAHPVPPASRVAPGAAVAHAAMRRLARQGRKQRDQTNASEYHPQPSNSEPEPEPMSVEPSAPAEASTSSQQQQQEQATKPVVSGLKYNFPRFLPRYPMPAIKAEALAAIDEQLRDIPIQFIIDDILINLAPVYVCSLFRIVAVGSNLL
jgi:hypothetical protein